MSRLQVYASCDASWNPATGRAGLAVQVSAVHGNREVVPRRIVTRVEKAVESSAFAEELAIHFAHEVLLETAALLNAVPRRIRNDCLNAVRKVQRDQRAKASTVTVKVNYAPAGHAVDKASRLARQEGELHGQ